MPPASISIDSAKSAESKPDDDDMMDCDPLTNPQDAEKARVGLRKYVQTPPLRSDDTMKDADDAASLHSIRPESRISSLDGNMSSETMSVSPDEDMMEQHSSAPVRHTSQTTEVFEPETSLRPKCWQYHGKAKAKNKTDGPGICNQHPNCNEAVIVHSNASSAAQANHQTATSTHQIDRQDQLHDWIVHAKDPSSSFFSRAELRRNRLPYAPFYTKSDLETAVHFADDEINTLYPRFLSLRSYLERDNTHGIQSHSLPHVPSVLEILQEEAADAAVLSRKDLRSLICEMAELIDWLVDRVEKFEEMIVWVKKANAKQGGWAEIKDLLRLGFVDEEWVSRECQV